MSGRAALDDSAPMLFTIGHSNHALERFLALLGAHRIDALVDARSQPYSRHAAHFNRERLSRSLEAARIQYRFLGAELGGRPAAPEFYDAEGHVLYARLAESPRFRAAIDAIAQDANRLRIAVLCSEEDPRHCHRKLLIARVLRARGVAVLHVRGDGRVEAEPADAVDPQLALLADASDTAWRSTRPVPRRTPHRA